VVGVGGGLGSTVEIAGNREPFRPSLSPEALMQFGHCCDAGYFTLAREFKERGEILLGGAFADPVDGAVFVFRVSDASIVEGFVSRDPYVASGLVTAWRIRPWTVVGGCTQPDQGRSG
jgi:hypothetical protein